MKQLITLAIIAVFAFACGNSNDSKASTEDTNASASTETVAAADGEKVYKQYCVTCHGLYGDMGASGAFNLVDSKLSMEERVAVISNGREGTNMVGFKSILKEDQIQAVSKYIETLRK